MIDVTKVTKVYRGRPGCACGCRGKYFYASKHADLRADWNQDSNDNVSDRQVKLAVAYLNRNSDTKFETGSMSTFAYVETDTRTTVVYFERS